MDKTGDGMIATADLPECFQTDTVLINVDWVVFECVDCFAAASQKEAAAVLNQVQAVIDARFGNAGLCGKGAWMLLSPSQFDVVCAHLAPDMTKQQRICAYQVRFVTPFDCLFHFMLTCVNAGSSTS